MGLSLLFRCWPEKHNQLYIPNSEPIVLVSILGSRDLSHSNVCIGMYVIQIISAACMMIFNSDIIYVDLYTLHLRVSSDW